MLNIRRGGQAAAEIVECLQDWNIKHSVKCFGITASHIGTKKSAFVAIEKN